MDIKIPLNAKNLWKKSPNCRVKLYLQLDISPNSDHDRPMVKKDVARAWCSPVFLVAAVLMWAAGMGCAGPGQSTIAFRYRQDEAIRDLQAKQVPYPAARFVVLSDPHYYHPGLGTSGPAFEKYIADDRKMLAKSDEILDSAINRVRRENADFILVCGDLTKDGEKINHLRFAGKMRELLAAAPVYVVPGNHDVANGVARRYTKTGSEPVATVSPGEFRQIYADFGYGEALYADDASLSYVVEPAPGLWVLALDSCLWRENEPGKKPVTDGRFSDQTLGWIEEMLIRAKRRQKAVIALMHHGLIEHYPANEKYYGEYVVDNSEAVSGLLAAYGVRLVFTGHFHAQDITVKQAKQPSARVYDVETGSLVTWPCPYRIVEISGQGACTIESRFIDAVASMPGGFPAYARQFAFRGTVGLANDALEKYRVSEKGQEILAPQIAEAYLAHLAGDENRPEEVIDPEGSGLMGRIVVFFQEDLVEGWWTDLAPPDNRLAIDLESCTHDHRH